MQYKIIDVNETQYKQGVQRLQSLRMQVVLWLVVLALGVFLIPLMLITSWVRNDVTRLESELLAVQNDLNNATSPSGEVTRISADIEHVNALITTMQTVTIPSGVDWPKVVDAATQYDPAAIEIDSLTQTNEKLEITGLATNNDAVVRYQQTMLDSGVFRDVLVVSMSTVPPPTPEIASDPKAGPANKANTDTERSDRETAGIETAEASTGNVEFIIDVIVGSAAP